MGEVLWLIGTDAVPWLLILLHHFWFLLAGPTCPWTWKFSLSFWEALHDRRKTMHLPSPHLLARRTLTSFPVLTLGPTVTVSCCPPHHAWSTALCTQWTPVPRTGFFRCSLVLCLIFWNCYPRACGYTPSSCLGFCSIIKLRSWVGPPKVFGCLTPRFPPAALPLPEETQATSSRILHASHWTLGFTPVASIHNWCLHWVISPASVPL